VPKPPFAPSVSGGRRAQLLERAALALRTRQFAEAEQLAADAEAKAEKDVATTVQKPRQPESPPPAASCVESESAPQSQAAAAAS